MFVYVDGKRYAAHRLAWFYVYKVWPKGLVDHRDNSGLNNAILNLREANKSTNGANRNASHNNKSGFKGVAPHKKAFVARIKVNRKLIHLGRFKEAAAAARAYDDAAIEHFGEFALTNKQLGRI
ncbi:HNH endonuclease [Novosphingobium subterraneum]|uniref:HNH endonuclease n=1 Tax=Novosphingobium subterraneum TaxID=48936 RepID=UPI003D010B33